MKKTFVLLLILLISIKSFACSCECKGDCSFSQISKGSGFVALIKVIEYSDFTDEDDYDEKMPLSMTVEVIEKYIGSENRQRIKIWGDNGMLCRPYIENFKIGKYYLIAPSLIEMESEYSTGNINDYDFFSCWTDYLNVNYEKKIAYGKYSKKENQVSLKDFEKEIKIINFKKTEWFTNNNQKNFFKSDSITLYKILNKKDEFVKLNNGLIKTEQNENKDFTTLEFKRNRKLKMTDTNIENWTETEHLGKWKWKFNNDKNILSFYLDKKLYSSFAVVSQERDYLIWNTDDKVQFYVLKLKRMKK